MKRVVVAMQNTLVSEVVALSLKKRDIVAGKALNDTPCGIEFVCRAFVADVLVMDVTRFGSGTLDNRMATVEAVRKSSPDIKICLVCDNQSDGELSYKVANAKAMGLIDAFFYQSVPSDYIADVIDTM